MNRSAIVRCLSALILGAACLAPRVAVTSPMDPPKPAESIALKGTCTFGGKKTDWSAKLTPKGNDTYAADYVSSWSGKPLHYIGTIKSDLKTEISGTGKANGGGNGTFEFSGKCDNTGIAQCTYKEVGGRRTGAMTVEMPKP